MFGFLKRRQSAHPSQPWLQNKAWADGLIPAVGDAANASALLVIGLSFTAATVGAVLYQYYDGFEGFKWGAIIVCFIFAVSFTAGAFYTRALRRKFGRTYFKLESNPGVVGGVLSGFIQMEKPLQEPTSFLVKLMCLEAIPNRPNDSQLDNRAKIIWEARDGISVSRSSLTNPQNVPVRFQLPRSALETNDASSRRPISWQLEVKARLQGLDFNAVFEVPVYRMPAGVETVVL
jgi:hypothetical protein